MTVRFGLVGCGRIGSTADDRVRSWACSEFWLPYSHASAIVSTLGAKLVSVCDIKQAAASEAMMLHGADASYVDYQEMLKKEQLDVVAIATRTQERVAIAHASIRMGVQGIYYEKPLSNTLEDADQLVKAVEAAGVHFVYGTKRRFMPVYNRVRKRLINGELGDIVTIIVRFGFGSLLWSLPHAVDMASFFAFDAEVESVSANLTLDESSVSGLVIDSDPLLKTAVIRFCNGIQAVLVAGHGMDVEISGSTGLVHLEADGTTVRWRRMLTDGSDLGWCLDQFTDQQNSPSSGTQLSIEYLVEAIKTRLNPGYGARIALHNHEILFAMMESQLLGGQPVKFPLTRRRMVITGRTGSLLA